MSANICFYLPVASITVGGYYIHLVKPSCVRLFARVWFTFRCLLLRTNMEDREVRFPNSINGCKRLTLL